MPWLLPFLNQCRCRQSRQGRLIVAQDEAVAQVVIATAAVLGTRPPQDSLVVSSLLFFSMPLACFATGKSVVVRSQAT